MPWFWTNSFPFQPHHSAKKLRRHFLLISFIQQLLHCIHAFIMWNVFVETNNVKRHWDGTSWLTDLPIFCSNSSQDIWSICYVGFLPMVNRFDVVVNKGWNLLRVRSTTWYDLPNIRYLLTWFYGFVIFEISVESSSLGSGGFISPAYCWEM